MAQSTQDQPIWKNRNFISLWFGTICSAIADSAVFILLSWFIIDVTGSEAILGTALLCMSLPRLVFILFGGVMADRFNRKLVLGFSLLARTIIIGLFSLFLINGDNQWLVPAVYIMSVSFGIVDSFFWPARSSIVPQVIPKERLATANSIMETSQQLSVIIGPMLASLLLYTTTDYKIMFSLIAVVFLLSTAPILTLRISNASESQSGNSFSSLMRDTLEGIRYVLPIRSIVIILLTAMFLDVMFVGPINIGLPVLIKQLGWDGASLGFLEGAIGAGAIIGALITGWAKGFRGYYFPTISLLISLVGVGIATLSFMEKLPFGLLAMFATGLCLTMINIPIFTYIQTIVENRMLGRVMSLLMIMSTGLIPVGYSVSAFILQHRIATPHQLILFGGICLSLVGLSTLLFKDFRQMEQHPTWKQTQTDAKQESVSSATAM